MTRPRSDGDAASLRGDAALVYPQCRNTLAVAHGIEAGTADTATARCGAAGTRTRYFGLALHVHGKTPRVLAASRRADASTSGGRRLADAIARPTTGAWPVLRKHAVGGQRGQG